MMLVLNSFAVTTDVAQQMSFAFQVGIGIATILAAFGLGLLLRRLLVRRLHKTVLDNWIIQTLGILIIIVPTLLGVTGALAIFNASLVLTTLTENFFPNPHLAIGTAWSLVETILILVLGNGVARTVRGMMTRSLGASRVDINMRTFFARILYIVILSITGFFILTVWNVPIGIPVAVLSAFTVTITVAFQDILKNLVAGFYILVERPFYIGDQINVTSGMITYVGKVEDIQLRATRLRLTSGEEVSVPNLFIFSNAVINNTHFGERRSLLVLTMPQEDFDRDETTSKILLLLKGYQEVLPKPDPIVMVNNYEDSKVSLQIRFWVATGQVIDISNVVYELHNLFANADISVREPL
ncbi:mechanosensitive ion channel family protein [Dictyobacter formicarum]|nr:mechanosensitive ion channel domain-containing protein [Dictyobacter formicarum]